MAGVTPEDGRVRLPGFAPIGSPAGRGSARLGALAFAVSLAFALGCAPHASPPGRTATPSQPLIQPEHYAHSIAALGFPGARRAFQIGSGSVVSSGEVALEFGPAAEAGAATSATAAGANAGAAATPTVTPVYFERDGVPIAHWWSIAAGESTHLEAAAIPWPALGDTSLLLAVRATFPAQGSRTQTITLRVRGTPSGPHYWPWDAALDSVYIETWEGRMALRNGRVVAWLGSNAEHSPDAPTRDHPVRTRGRGPGALLAGLSPRTDRSGVRTCEVYLPAYPIEPALAKQIARSLDYAAVASEARSIWRKELARAAPLVLPDSLVTAAYRAALVTLLMDHERSGEDWVPIGNPFQYRDVWLRDGAQVVRALSVAGVTDLARADAWTLRRFQFPAGVFISQFGQMDGTGQALWAFHEAATRPPSPEWAIRFLPLGIKGMHWIERQRGQLAKLSLEWSGLLPYAEPRDNEMVRAQLVGNDAWSIAGERAVAGLAALAGEDSLARTATDVSEGYRALFLASLARGHFADVPPSWQAKGRDWGNLAVAWPARVLAAKDPRLAALARRVLRLDPTGARAGLVAHTRDSLHTYLGSELAEWSLLADRPEIARSWLADLVAHSSSSLGFAEAFSARDGGFGTNLPPHGTAAARLIQLVRDMLINDIRDTLEIASGGDASWWNGTRFEGAPTRFGMIDLALDRPDPATIEARWSAVAVPARVRVPDGFTAVESLNPGTRVVDGRWIECPPHANAARARITATGQARR